MLTNKYKMILISLLSITMLGGCGDSTGVTILEKNSFIGKDSTTKVNTDKVVFENTSVSSTSTANLNVSNNADSNGLKEVLSNLDKDSNVIYTYYSAKLSGEEVYEEIRAAYPKAVIFGSSSSSDEILSSKGIVNGIAMLGIKEKSGTVGSAGKSLTATSNIKEELTKLIGECRTNAGVSSSTKPTTIYVSTQMGLEEHVDEAIAEIVGKDVPIYGGTPAANSSGATIASSICSSGSVDGVSIMCYFDSVGASYKSGFVTDKNGKSGKVTEISDERTIVTIDGRNAMDVINEWTNNAYSSSGVVSSDKLFNLLAIDRDGETVTMAMNSVSQEGVNMYANIKVGDTMNYIPAQVEPLINRAEPLVRDALINGSISKNNINYSLVVLCAGARAKIGKDLSKYTDLLDSSLGKTPWIGVVANGEEGYVKGVGSFHGNFMNSIVIRETKE